MVLKGIAASKGIAIAKVFEFNSEEIKIEKKEISNVDFEVNRLMENIDLTIEQIQKIKENALKNVSEDQASIFDAHILVANDPMLISEYREIIINDKLNAEYAVDKVSKRYIQMFKSMEDQYMKERSVDIKDVSERIILNLLGKRKQDLSSINHEVIIVSNDLTPSETSQLDKKFIKGFATNIGGLTSHSAILARSLSIPAVVGLESITDNVESGDIIAINGFSGEVFVNPSEEIIKQLKDEIKKIDEKDLQLKKFINAESKTKDGHKVIIAANIGSNKFIENVLEVNCDAIGLVRSEFLYMDSLNWPSEEFQFNAYKQILESLNNKQVIIRTLDIGGDKNLKYYDFKKETNPFLGFRAIRFCLANKDIFKTQLRALIRASEFGNLGIMFPMISTIDEFKQAKEFYLEVYKEVKKEFPNISNNIEVGMMIEVPAAAIISDQFCKYVDFVSIGTNDLIQYSMAADRINEDISYLYQPLNPSILKLIKLTIDGAHKNNKWAGMCGEMANDLNILPILLGMGLDEFSMSPNNVLAARELLSRINLKDAQELANKCLEAENSEQVKEIIEKYKKW